MIGWGQPAESGVVFVCAIGLMVALVGLLVGDVRVKLAEWLAERAERRRDNRALRVGVDRLRRDW